MSKLKPIYTKTNGKRRVVTSQMNRIRLELNLRTLKLKHFLNLPILKSLMLTIFSPSVTRIVEVLVSVSLVFLLKAKVRILPVKIEFFFSVIVINIGTEVFLGGEECLPFLVWQYSLDLN